MTDFQLRELILEHIREMILHNIDNIKNCENEVEFAKNEARRETLLDLHKWINEETRR